MNAEDLFDPEALRRWRESNAAWRPGQIEYNNENVRPGSLQVFWQPQGWAVCDHGGFLTYLDYIEDLRDILIVEYSHPGALRKALTGQSYRWDERHQQRPRLHPDNAIGKTIRAKIKPDGKVEIDLTLDELLRPKP